MAEKNQIKFPFTFQEEYRSCMGIYKLEFNDHFFIGGAKRILKRAYQHSEEIERRLRLGPKEKDIHSNIIKYLQETQWKSFVFVLLFEVRLESELPEYEQKIFDLVRDNPKCLNTTFTAAARTYKQKEDLQPVTVKPLVFNRSKKAELPADFIGQVDIKISNPGGAFDSEKLDRGIQDEATQWANITPGQAKALEDFRRRMAEIKEKKNGK